jgi:hypothetical protein
VTVWPPSTRSLPKLRPLVTGPAAAAGAPTPATLGAVLPIAALPIAALPNAGPLVVEVSLARPIEGYPGIGRRPSSVLGAGSAEGSLGVAGASTDGAAVGATLGGASLGGAAGIDASAAGIATGAGACAVGTAASGTTMGAASAGPLPNA